ncbi:MAG: helix-turn-helix domain-containing protein [Alcanivoracaceae bacterium]|nr:helix-turn-helix domain-containing protein [Alcanivoracaceae bacterium]
MKWQETGEVPCPVARSLSVIGDRWTLLVIRNAFFGMSRFDQFQRNLGVTRHVLTERLNRMVECDILQKVLYQQRPPRYEYQLTDKGRDIYPILMTLTAWGDKWMPLQQGASLFFRHKECGKIFTPILHCSECGEAAGVETVMPVRSESV